MTVPDSGALTVDVFLPQVTLTDGDAALIDKDAAALVVLVFEQAGPTLGVRTAVAVELARHSRCHARGVANAPTDADVSTCAVGAVLWPRAR